MPSIQIDQEFKELIPPLLEEEYQQLKQNIITANKCKNAIMLWNGIIIDGHNRFYICVEHGIEFEVKDLHFDSREDAKLWILENQLGRRNLTDAARIELALSKEEILRKRAKERQIQGGQQKGKLLTKSSTESEETINVRESLAKEAKVSQGSMSQYKQIKEHDNQIILEKIKNGELKIYTAYRMLPKELKKQFEEADKILKFINERLPLIKENEMCRDVNEKLANLTAQFHNLLERRS